jgi:hypothetical protein
MSGATRAGVRAARGLLVGEECGERFLRRPAGARGPAVAGSLGLAGRRHALRGHRMPVGRLAGAGRRGRTGRDALPVGSLLARSLAPPGRASLRSEPRAAEVRSQPCASAAAPALRAGRSLDLQGDQLTERVRQAAGVACGRVPLLRGRQDRGAVVQARAGRRAGAVAAAVRGAGRAADAEWLAGTGQGSLRACSPGGLNRRHSVTACHAPGNRCWPGGKTARHPGRATEGK